MSLYNTVCNGKYADLKVAYELRYAYAYRYVLELIFLKTVKFELDSH